MTIFKDAQLWVVLCIFIAAVAIGAIAMTDPTQLSWYSGTWYNGPWYSSN